MNRFVLPVITLLVVCLCLPSCSSSHKFAKVEDVTSSNKVTRGIHVVDHGESLYSIAFGYGRDYRTLAAVNHMQYPYKIVRGQIIHLNKRTYNSHQHSNKSAKNNNKLPIINKTIKSRQEKPQVNQNVKVKSWAWPLNGKLTAKYGQGNKFNKGIDIAVNNTKDVKSSADGLVVYRGAGLKGYGKLIIIKHSEQYLTAYAHNDWFVVREGQKVKKGQKIAVIGNKMKKLHFEIRKYGKPVDPLKYLPA